MIVSEGASPPPESIQNAPELRPGLGLFYTAFLDLTGCRQLGDAMGPIDWIAIDRYCQRHSIEGEQYEDMHYMISRMDLAFMSHFREKNKAAHEAAMRKAKQKSQRKPPVRRGR